MTSPKGNGAYSVWYLLLLYLHISLCQVILKFALVVRACGKPGQLYKATVPGAEWEKLP